MVELDKLEYHFKLDLELKYVFTHIEKSSLIKLLNTIFEIELPLDSEDVLVRECKTLSDMWVEEAVEKVEKKGIQAFITGFRNVNMTEDTILEQLVLSYGLSKEEVLKYLQK